MSGKETIKTPSSTDMFGNRAKAPDTLHPGRNGEFKSYFGYVSMDGMT